MSQNPAQRIYQCEFCSFTAKQKRNLEAHKSTHTGEKPHLCPNCESAFADPSALVRHRKAKHGYETKGRRTSPQIPTGDGVFVHEPHFGGPAGQSPYPVQTMPHQTYSTPSSQPGNSGYSTYPPCHNASQPAPYPTDSYYRQQAMQNGSMMGSDQVQGAIGRQDHGTSAGYSYQSPQAGNPQYDGYGQLIDYPAYNQVPSGWPNTAVYPVPPNGYDHQQQWPDSYGSTNRNPFA
ncbi:hypothetical protein CONPUDRAFT_139896 [Coniophora puteana RWD-64-598 SS2]|uniref:C2H2-type domain-containing protein n=1 Tax=Coniophora puteana (strain RWD-64-598) TaxID=741705 RepID=A0A5M3MBG5_CONPW|nr:uncharacterized protein CONPUDRAFT_139896 [Coniophora puteana RWD-64-598 SS2]EIW75975.1 hypothetical protein CONPUDRAFT_139896 [Coniophora puteana RWD-64-598 SS2]